MLFRSLSVALTKEWEEWNDATSDSEINAVAERRRAILEVQCGTPEGYIPCFTYGFSPAGPANAAGCLDIQWPNCEWRGRSITCRDGYYAQAPNNPYILLSPGGGFGGCHDIDECAVYGCSRNCANYLSCSQLPGVNQRTITCQPNYYASGAIMGVQSLVLTGSSVFGGCLPVKFCITIGFSGNTENTVSCVDGVGSRTITCELGFRVTGSATGTQSTVTLVGTTAFTGCQRIDTCTEFGFKGSSQVNGATCSQGDQVWKRTITCRPGYGIVGTTTDLSILATYQNIVGDGNFKGCAQLDMCNLYGASGQSLHVKDCTSTAPNQRTISCDTGFFPIGGSGTTETITLVGATNFAGCSEQNLCTTDGYSGRNDFTLSCVPRPSERTVTCMPGYHAGGSASPISESVTLSQHTPFTGCTLINMCNQYGDSGNRDQVIACIPGINSRTLVCDRGFFAIAPAERRITLQGNAKFLGCSVIDTCAVYGFSNKSEHTTRCVSAENERTIYCAVGYDPVGVGAGLATDRVVLTGPVPFQGCVDRDECAAYGYSGNAAYVTSCVSGTNNRTITCATGYAAVAPNIPQIVLTGPAPFNGCFLIQTCVVYGTSNRSANVESCVQRVANNRTITCIDGYKIAGTVEDPMVVLVGPKVFPGCVLVDMCARYGFSNRSAHTLRCVTGVNNRNITCQPGYHVLRYDHDHMVVTNARPYPTSIVLKGYDDFLGCFAVCGDGSVTTGEQCDDGNTESGDGCTSSCVVEDNFVCPIPGEACCFGGGGRLMDRFQSSMGVVCRDGFWMRNDLSKRDTDHKIVLSSSEQLVINGDNHLRFCGTLSIQNSGIVISEDGILTVAGHIEVADEGSLSVTTKTAYPRVNILPPCRVLLGLGYDERDSGLNVLSGGTVEVVQNSPIPVNSNPSLANANIRPIMNINGCVRYNGRFHFVAQGIPYTENYFPLSNSTSWTDCLFEVDPNHVSSTLPGCPILGIDHSDSFVRVISGTHNMCPGAIAGLVVGLVAAVVLAGIAAFLLLGSGGGETMDYVTL